MISPSNDPGTELEQQEETCLYFYLFQSTFDFSLISQFKLLGLFSDYFSP
jgi:hypothetical protein